MHVLGPHIQIRTNFFGFLGRTIKIPWSIDSHHPSIWARNYRSFVTTLITPLFGEYLHNLPPAHNKIPCGGIRLLSASLSECGSRIIRSD
jgi:hypothetical protein